jgi:hypothetical protein
MYRPWEINKNYLDLMEYTSSNSATQSVLAYELTFQATRGSLTETASIAGHSRWTILPCFSDETPIRSLFVCRIVTGSSPVSWSFSVLHPTSSIWNADISSSAYLAELMKQPDWNTLKVKADQLFSGGFVTSSLNNALTSSRDNYGYFDGVYFSWDKYYTNIQVSDIALKLK